ncbi:merozoite TRAP-like protein, putative [Plasmodium vinckei lentum]|uniref:Merozoite TRAP-like protein, putative n=1 Tax=Plasmodium vinckei lentum TaxID=138297 RepID=A0A6V7RZ46_PLAVN|nr:merozoite TRAP-like protein, putative [Plasmodium vinckei lentum]
MKTHITSYLYAYVLFVIIQIKYNSANETCDNWGPWSPCDNQLTTRTCLNNPSLKEEENCTQCNEWSEWLECKDGKRSRHIINCPFINETQDCITDINGEVIYKNNKVIFDNPNSENQEGQSSNSEGTIKPHFLQTQDTPQPAKAQDSTQKETPPATETATQEKKQDQAGTDQAASISTGNSDEKNIAGTGSEKTDTTSQDKSTTVTTEGDKADVKSGEDTLKSTTEEETSKVNTDKGASAPGVSGEEVKVTDATVPGTNTLESTTPVVSTPTDSTVDATAKKEPNAESGATDELSKQNSQEGVSQIETPVKQAEETSGNKDTADNSGGDGKVDKAEESTGQGAEAIPPVVPEKAGTDLSLDLSPDLSSDISAYLSSVETSIPSTVSTSDASPTHEGKSVEASPELSATTNESDADITRSSIDPIISEINTDSISSTTSTTTDTELNNIHNRNSDLNSTSMYTYNDPNMNNNLHSHMDSRHGESMGRSYKFGALRNGLPSNYHGHNGPYRDMHHMNNSNNIYENSHKSNLRNNVNDENPSEYNNGNNRHCNCNTNNAHETSEPHESHRAYGNEERDHHNRYGQSGYNNSEEHDHFSKLYVASGMGVVILLSGAIASYALYNDKNKQNVDSIFSNGFADIPASKMIHEDEFWGTE